MSIPFLALTPLPTMTEVGGGETQGAGAGDGQHREGHPEGELPGELLLAEALPLHGGHEQGRVVGVARHRPDTQGGQASTHYQRHKVPAGRSTV